MFVISHRTAKLLPSDMESFFFLSLPLLRGIFQLWKFHIIRSLLNASSWSSWFKVFFSMQFVLFVVKFHFLKIKYFFYRLCFKRVTFSADHLKINAMHKENKPLGLFSTCAFSSFFTFLKMLFMHKEKRFSFLKKGENSWICMQIFDANLLPLFRAAFVK